MKIGWRTVDADVVTLDGIPVEGLGSSELRACGPYLRATRDERRGRSGLLGPGSRASATHPDTATGDVTEPTGRLANAGQPFRPVVAPVLGMPGTLPARPRVKRLGRPRAGAVGPRPRARRSERSDGGDAIRRADSCPHVAAAPTNGDSRAAADGHTHRDADGNAHRDAYGTPTPTPTLTEAGSRHGLAKPDRHRDANTGTNIHAQKEERERLAPGWRSAAPGQEYVARFERCPLRDKMGSLGMPLRVERRWRSPASDSSSGLTYDAYRAQMTRNAGEIRRERARASARARRPGCL